MADHNINRCFDTTSQYWIYRLPLKTCWTLTGWIGLSGCMDGCIDGCIGWPPTLLGRPSRPMHLGPHRILVPTLRLLILTGTDFSKFISEQYHNRYNLQKIVFANKKCAKVSIVFLQQVVSVRVYCTLFVWVICTLFIRIASPLPFESSDPSPFRSSVSSSSKLLSVPVLFTPGVIPEPVVVGCACSWPNPDNSSLVSSSEPIPARIAAVASVYFPSTGSL